MRTSTRSLFALVAVAFVAVACSNPDSGTGQSATSASPPDMTVRLVDYPLFPTPVVEPDQVTLDRIANDYADTLSGADPEMERFLFGEVPVRVFDDLFSGRSEISGPTARWLLHVSGYFGGRWLRGEIAAAQPDAPLVGFSRAPTIEGFATTMARAQQGVDAAGADDLAAVAFARSSLLDGPPSEPGGAPVPGLTDSFGYNAGYNLEILSSPPAGLQASARYDVRCTGLLRCEYASPRLPAVGELEVVADALNGGDAGYGDLVALLQPIQDAAIPRGRSVWSSGLSVQGFPQRSYDQLLEVSSSFLETVQSTALTMARADATGDVDAARTGAQAVAAMVVWLDAYRAGLLDGEGAIELPSFTV